MFWGRKGRGLSLGEDNARHPQVSIIRTEKARGGNGGYCHDLLYAEECIFWGFFSDCGRSAHTYHYYSEARWSLVMWG